jgi:hypothetical protein
MFRRQKLNSEENRTHAPHASVRGRTGHDRTWENKNMAPIILNSGTSCRCVVIFTPRPLYPQMKDLITHWIKTGWAPEPVWPLTIGDQSNPWSLPDIKPRLLGRSHGSVAPNNNVCNVFMTPNFLRTFHCTELPTTADICKALTSQANWNYLFCNYFVSKAVT